MPEGGKGEGATHSVVWDSPLETRDRNSRLLHSDRGAHLQLAVQTGDLYASSELTTRSGQLEAPVNLDKPHGPMTGLGRPGRG